MGSLSLIIVLIIVVWVIVLAPMVMGNNKPIRRSGEGYDETRVLHAGGTEPVSGRRRPKLTPADVHRFEDDGDYEVVEAVDALEPAEEDLVLAQDSAGSTAVTLRGFFNRRDGRRDAGSPDGTDDMVEGEVVEPDNGVDGESTETPEGAGSPETAGSTAYSVLTAEDRGSGEEGSRDAARGERVDAAHVGAAEESEPYALDETYESPRDYGYRGAEDASDETAGAGPVCGEDAAAGESAGSTVVTAGAADAAEDTGVEREENVPAEEGELTAEEIEFARSRSGRGGWDPEREKASKADRFQRRQRTLLALIVADVVTFVAAFVVGGWTWVLPVAAIVLTVVFMSALRKVVRQERALQAHRVRQLRRARMGVISQESGAAATRFRRRPGAVIVEMDDESPDFEELPVYRAPVAAEAPQLGRDFRPVPLREDYRTAAQAS